jgi:hypothetical protein
MEGARAIRRRLVARPTGGIEIEWPPLWSADGR